MFIPEIKEGLNGSSNAFLILLLTIIFAGIWGSFYLLSDEIQDLKAKDNKLEDKIDKNLEKIHKNETDIVRITLKKG